MKIRWLLLLVLTSCAGKGGKMDYPGHWWEPVPEAARESWEILPQAADRGRNEVILSKRNELGLLSNFAGTSFKFHGKEYASVEGFWQMMKYPERGDDPRISPGIHWDYSREQVAALTGFEAQSAGAKAEANMAKLGIDWVTFEGERIYFKTDPTGIDRHYKLILEATRAKVDQNPTVKKLLLSTGNLRLLPDHQEREGATKAWKYYDILMRLRDEWRGSKNRK